MQSMLQQLVGFLAVFFGVTAAVAELRHYRQGIGEAEHPQPSFDQGFASQVAGLEDASEGTSLLSTSFSRSRVTVSEVPFAGKQAPRVRMETVTLGTLSAICAAMTYLANDIGDPACGDVKVRSKSICTSPVLLKPIAVEASTLLADESKTKPADLNGYGTCGVPDQQSDGHAGSGIDVNVDYEAKVQTLDKAAPARSRRPPSFHSRLALIDEANAEVICTTPHTRSLPLSRPLPAPGDFQRLFRDTRRAFAEALEDLEKEDWENRLHSPEGTGLFRESQKAFTSALEDIESEDQRRCPPFVSVN